MKNTCYTDIYPNLGNENKVFKISNTKYTYIHYFQLLMKNWKECRGRGGKLSQKSHLSVLHQTG